MAIFIPDPSPRHQFFDDVLEMRKRGVFSFYAGEEVDVVLQVPILTEGLGGREGVEARVFLGCC